MDLIDDEGRLFGYVNVIDALVVLLVLAVVVAGIAVVDPFGSGNNASSDDDPDRGTPAVRFVTLDLGDLDPSMAEQISTGDRVSIDRSQKLYDVTDVYVSPTSTNRTEQITTLLRLQLNGTLVESDRFEGKVFHFDGSQISFGQAMTLEAIDYSVKGNVVATSSDRSFNTTETRTVVKLSAVSPEVADDIETGLTETVYGRRLARVTDVRTEPATVIVTSDDGQVHEREHPRKKDIYLTVELRTRRTGNGLQFHGDPLRTNTTVSLDLGTVVVQGTVVGVER